MGFIAFACAMVSCFDSPLVILVSFVCFTRESVLTRSLVVGPGEHGGFFPALVLAHHPDHLLPAITSQLSSLNVFSKLITSSVSPGRPIAGIIFKVYSSIMVK